ncbi:DUF3293 domain-containing protein [Catenovulum sp. SM1970]|uniref:DUF3293 domain-containing protein n=1 Tax=Marinifaba aquimaris TaxID=2741323 RepID=UPI0015749FB5|nr:DUF3293 domain-containing protein [Marinifaba aquimaris]NTS78510.1 DUF3293 domain-containing protein [Marinifaba aquimaris]
MSKLWQIYQSVYFVFEQNQNMPADDFAVITAMNPKGQPVGSEENRKQMNDLAKVLHESEVHFFKTLVMSQSYDYAEQSHVCICNLTQAKKWGVLFEQNAIYYVRSGKLYLEPCLLNVQSVLLGQFTDYLKYN